MHPKTRRNLGARFIDIEAVWVRVNFVRPIELLVFGALARNYISTSLFLFLHPHYYAVSTEWIGLNISFKTF
jgi:hypothetical protein